MVKLSYWIVFSKDKKMIKQNSFLELAHYRKLRCEKFLDEMELVVPWKDMMSVIKPYYVAKDNGRPRFDLLLMLKIYCLQQWYNLSDPGAEENIYDRNSFQKFLDIDLIAHQVPDETTILNFRHLLEEYDLPKQFFALINQKLIDQGLIVKEGTSVDATIIKAPSSTKNKNKKRDPEMSSTKKGNQYFFGMKAHIGGDSEQGLVHTLQTTTAKVHDKEMMNTLLHGEEKAIFADKGYFDDKMKKQYRIQDKYWGVLDKGKRNHPLSCSQKKRNHKLSTIRSKIEFPFGVIKCLWRYVKVRYRGLHKNTMQLFSLFALSNLYRARKKLLALSI